MEYHNNFLPGDMVGIKDDGYIEIPKGYYYSGMILKEKAPIHTFIYYVMLYPKNKNAENHIKIVEVPEEHLILNRFINRDHFICKTSRNCGKSYLSSTYGEVLNNGQIKQND